MNVGGYRCFVVTRRSYTYWWNWNIETLQKKAWAASCLHQQTARRCPPCFLRCTPHLGRPIKKLLWRRNRNAGRTCGAKVTPLVTGKLGRKSPALTSDQVRNSIMTLFLQSTDPPREEIVAEEFALIELPELLSAGRRLRSHAHPGPDEITP